MYIDEEMTAIEAQTAVLPAIRPALPARAVLHCQNRTGSVRCKLRCVHNYLTANPTEEFFPVSSVLGGHSGKNRSALIYMIQTITAHT